MPYIIVPKGKGYVVMSEDKHRALSSRQLTKKEAQRQRVAVALAEYKKNPAVPIKRYFA